MSLYELGRSTKLCAGVDARTRVLNVQNRVRGINARRGDGTFGELIPHAAIAIVPGFKVARGPVATIEVGAEVKILAKAMIKQIDRVMTDLQNQRREFLTAGGTPITVAIVGINHAFQYVRLREIAHGQRMERQTSTRRKRPTRLRTGWSPALPQTLTSS